MTTPLDLRTIEKLAHVRLLHQQGIEQSGRPEPLSAPSILSFHDAVEMFYVVACQHLGIDSLKLTFDQYWPQIRAKVGNLGQQRGMEMLNRARNDYKHNVQIPGARRVAEARDVVNAFLIASTPMIFGVDYSSVSMVDVVSQADIKALLRSAETATGLADRVEAMANIVDAWEELLNPRRDPASAEDSPALQFGPRVYKVISADNAAVYLHSEQASRRRPRGNEEIGRQLEAVTEAVMALQPAARLMAIGIDYAEYLRFRSLTPNLNGYMDGHWEWRAPVGYAPTEDHVAFCMQFVITAAVRLAVIEAQLDTPPWINPATQRWQQPWETIKTGQRR